MSLPALEKSASGGRGLHQPHLRRIVAGMLVKVVEERVIWLGRSVNLCLRKPTVWLKLNI